MQPTLKSVNATESDWADGDLWGVWNWEADPSLRASYLNSLEVQKSFCHDVIVYCLFVCMVVVCLGL